METLLYTYSLQSFHTHLESLQPSWRGLREEAYSLQLTDRQRGPRPTGDVRTHVFSLQMGTVNSTTFQDVSGSDWWPDPTSLQPPHPFHASVSDRGADAGERNHSFQGQLKEL